MKHLSRRVLIDAALIAAASCPSLGQTYHDRNGTVVPGVVVIGQSFFSEIVPANTTGVSIKASPGTVYSISLSSNAPSPLYVRLYDKATAPICGADAPVARFEVPANGTPANGSGSNLPFGTPGINFLNGIGLCVTSGFADSDTTTPAAGAGIVNIAYQ